MSTQEEFKVNKGAKDCPPLTDEAKAVLRHIRHTAADVSGFNGAEDTVGRGMENLVGMLWGEEASGVFTSEHDDGEGDILVPDDFPEVGKDGWEVQEPAFTAMGLGPRSGDKRPTLVTMMSLSRSKSLEHRNTAQYLKKNLHLVQLPTREQVATMMQSRDPKIQRLGVKLHRTDTTEEGRQDRQPSEAEKAEAEALINRMFGKRA